MAWSCLSSLVFLWHPADNRTILAAIKLLFRQLDCLTKPRMTGVNNFQAKVPTQSCKGGKGLVFAKKSFSTFKHHSWGKKCNDTQIFAWGCYPLIQGQHNFQFRSLSPASPQLTGQWNGNASSSHGNHPKFASISHFSPIFKCQMESASSHFWVFNT